jgi:GNAT superfamily N-acetyltransferase
MKASSLRKRAHLKVIAAEVFIRPLRHDEIAELVRLCGEHATYERADFAPDGKSEHLERAIFTDPPRLWCLVPEVDGLIVGYATCTKDFSTWRAGEYLHLDCLYLVPEYRGLGIGARLMKAIGSHAVSLGCTTVEWQTPPWNASAIRFYGTLGATASKKVRFRWNQL